MPLKILFLTDNFPPEVNAPATRTYEHCLEWIKLGAEVTVITCAPNFPQGKVYQGYRNLPYRAETVDGIRVIRVWSYITRNEGFLKRTLDYLSFAVTSFFAGMFQKADIIVATSPQFFTTFAGFALSKLKRRPWIFELRDLWPESIRTVGAMGDSKALDLLEKIELFLYRDASVVVALTPSFRDNLVRRGIPGSRIQVVTNGANTELFTPREKSRALLLKHGLQGKFVVGYIGTHGMAHGLESVVNALDRITDSGIHFLFIGDGAKKKDVVRLAREKRLQNVTFLDPVAKELVPEYMSLADVALVPLIKSDTFRTVIPSKIFEAAAMHTPILLGVAGQAQELIESCGAGLCFEPEDEGDFLAKLSLLRSDTSLYARLQKGCATLATQYDRRSLAKNLYEIMEEASRLNGPLD